MEEDEEIIFIARAKLYRFENKEWKERGIGDLKLLKHKQTGKVRLLMRREKIFKICANHYFHPSMELKAMSEKSWQWIVSADFAKEHPRLEHFCVRFPSRMPNNSSQFLTKQNLKIPNK